MYDFPSSPTDGQLYQGWVYRANPGAWMQTAAAPMAMTIADSMPANPFPGQMWWESDTGNAFVWYDDGSSQQWVQFNVGMLPEAPLDGQGYVRQSGGWAVQSAGVVKIAAGSHTSGSDQFTVALPSGYDVYELILTRVRLATSTPFYMRLSVDGGATYKAGATDYRNYATSMYDAMSGALLYNTTKASTVMLTAQHALINTADAYFVIRIPSAPAGGYPNFNFTSQIWNATPTSIRVDGGASLEYAGPVTNIQILANGGTGITACKWQLNGVR